VGNRERHLPSRSCVALQEVLVGLERWQHSELMQRAATFSTRSDLRMSLEELVDFGKEAERDTTG
jgi:hypothetical protein